MLTFLLLCASVSVRFAALDAHSCWPSVSSMEFLSVVIFFQKTSTLLGHIVPSWYIKMYAYTFNVCLCVLYVYLLTSDVLRCKGCRRFELELAKLEALK